MNDDVTTLTPDEKIEMMVEAGLLTEHEATCWVLRRVESEPGYSVAETLGISEQAVSNAVSNAVAKIISAHETIETVETVRWQAGKPPSAE